MAFKGSVYYLATEAKEEILKQRNEAEKELKERRADISRTERRLVQKEENLDKKAETLESKNEVLDRKIKENDVLKEQINELRMKELDVLERISGYSVQEAKDELVARVESEIKHELAQRLDALEAQFKEDADAKAKNIISLAIQRCAADHVAETTVSVVSIPSEDMKGRIIGREGRNIQMLEKLTIHLRQLLFRALIRFEERSLAILLRSLSLTVEFIRRVLRRWLKRQLKRSKRA